MNDSELTERLTALAVDLFPSAKAEGVKKLVRIFETINPGEYRELHRALFAKDATVKDYEDFCQPRDRLERLAIRLDDEGRYTDADICWINLR